MGWKIVYCDCPFNYDAFRKIVRRILRSLELEEPNIKENLVNNFLKTLPGLRKNKLSGNSISYCTICREPSRREKCKKCEIMN